MSTDQTIDPVVEQPATPPSLQLSDLVLALNIIQAVSKRGAILPTEMSVVGGVYDRLTQFLTASGAIAAPIQPKPPEEIQQ
jgi:hypothetical protein